jgi:hypothetical protein
MQILSGIPGLQLKVEWVGTIADRNHACIAQWLKQYGQLISHLNVQVHVSDARLKLREFAEAAASCRSLELALLHSSSEVVDLADLDPVAGCLCRFNCSGYGSLIGISAFSSMSRLVALRLDSEDFGSEEPWVLAKLRSLQQLELLHFTARGDPSPLSALTGLSLLNLNSLDLPADDASFSSLQPLSTLQQLEVLQMRNRVCDATSLEGLAGLSKLKKLELDCFGWLQSLEGINPGVVKLIISNDYPKPMTLAGIEGCTRLEKLVLNDLGVTSLEPLRGLSSMKELYLMARWLTSLESLDSMPLRSLTLTYCDSLTQLSGVEHLSALKSLKVICCDGVTSLQPLSQLGPGLQELEVCGCSKVREEVLELPHVQPTADVDVKDSNVREVVLAGGVRRAVRPVRPVRPV